MRVKLLIYISILGTLFVVVDRSHACNMSPCAILPGDVAVTKSTTVIFDGSGSFDPDSDGYISKYEWDFSYDGLNFTPDPAYTETSPHADGITTYRFAASGTYTVALRVTDNEGKPSDELATFKGYVQGTIQQAIGGAGVAEVIILYPGKYTGTGNRDITFGGKAIEVRSTDPLDSAVVASTIIDCQDSGRGFHFHNGEGAASVLSGLTIRNGDPDDHGGGIRCDVGTSPTIKDCTIIDNQADGSGGGIYCDRAAPQISNCLISSNIATQSGGGVYCYECTSNLEIIDCLFKNNVSQDNWCGGGGLCNDSSSPHVTGCVFVGNRAFFGGGMENIYYSGSSPSAPRVMNCVFTGNYARYDSAEPASGCGGGVDNYESCPELFNCTFSKNVAEKKGGGLFNYEESSYTGSTTEVTNCIFWGNADVGGTDRSAQIDYNEYGKPTVNYSCVQGWKTGRGGDGGTGMKNINPNLVDADDPDGDDDIFRTYDDGLVAPWGSVCIDTGNNSDVTGITEDIIGNDRTTDGDHNYEGDETDTVDMGAYELPRIWFVDTDAEGSGNGTSWSNAYNELYDALSGAASGDEIWVADGTYLPTASYYDRTASFELVNGVRVYGGLNGTEGARCERAEDVTTHETILSGDLRGNDGANFTYRSDNSCHVVTSDSGITAAAVLDGFTVRGGYADTYMAYGGGMYNDGSPTVANCIFTDNWCNAGGGGMSNGAYSGGSNPTVINCKFIANYSDGGGGGMYTYGDTSSPSRPTVINCIFSDNSAESDGGGMSHDYSSSTVINCTFTNNSANCGGGMYNFMGNGKDNYGITTLTNCLFIENSATYQTWGGNGGGLYNNESHPVLTNCTIADNEADEDGGGIYNVYSSSPTLTRCIISGNQAAGDAGGMYNLYSEPMLTNCIFSYNWAWNCGSGMYNYSSAAIVINCAFSRNLANLYDGGGMYNTSMSSPILTNSIFWDNGSESESDQIYGGTPVINYCCVQGWTGGFGGTGNTGGDPLFVSTNDLVGPDGTLWTYDDGLRIKKGSSCIDAGDPDSPFPNEPFWGSGRIDMGAYGNTIMASLIMKIDLDADANRDGAVNQGNPNIHDDEDDEDTWAKGPSSKGAIVLPNCDKDNTTTVAPDNWIEGDWDLQYPLEPEPPNRAVDNEADIADLAELWLHRLDYPSGSQLPDYLKITLKVEKVSGEHEFFGDVIDGVPAKDRIRIFWPTDSVSDPGNVVVDTGDEAVIGPEDGDTLEFVKTPGSGQKNYTTLKDSGIVKFAVEGIEFGAMVDITLTLEDTENGLTLGSDTVRMRVAPFVMADHSMSVDVDDPITDRKTVYVADDVYGNDNSDLQNKLDDKYGSHLDVSDTGDDPWQQDGYEVGYVKAPYGQMPVFLVSPRAYSDPQTLVEYVHNERLESNVGVCWQLESIADPDDLYNAFGNLESRPGDSGPGKLFCGKDLERAIKCFFAAQDINPRLEVNTDWLQVGHVDEAISFVPPRQPGDIRYTIVADPEVCWALLLWIYQEHELQNPVIWGGTSLQYVSNIANMDGLRDFNLETHVMAGDNLPSVRNKLGLASPETVTKRWSGNRELINAGAFVASFPDFPTSAKKRYYRITFIDSTDYRLDWNEEGQPEYQNEEENIYGLILDPVKGKKTMQKIAYASKDYDCIFKDAECFVLEHWLEGDFQANDTFKFEADPSCTTLEMPVLFVQYAPGKALAYTIDHVNCLVDGDRVFTGQTHEDDTGNLFIDYVKALFEEADFALLEVIDPDSQYYHNEGGDIHCGTNVQRVIPDSYKWWMFNE